MKLCKPTVINTEESLPSGMIISCIFVEKYLNLVKHFKELDVSLLLSIIIALLSLVYPHPQCSVINLYCACKTILAPLQVIQKKKQKKQFVSPR